MTDQKTPNASAKFVIQDARSNADGMALFWRKNAAGCTKSLDEAHLFTREEALAHYQSRSTDRPFAKDRLQPNIDGEVPVYSMTADLHLLHDPVMHKQTRGDRALFIDNEGAWVTDNVSRAAKFPKLVAEEQVKTNPNLIVVRFGDLVNAAKTNSIALEELDALIRESGQPRPAMNTRIDLAYRSESGKAHAVAILPGEISQETVNQISETLIDGDKVIAEQLGLPTPLEELINDGEPEDDDHVLTTLEAWTAGTPSAVDLLTTEPATTDLTPRSLALGLAFLDWDYQGEMERLGIPADGPSLS